MSLIFGLFNRDGSPIEKTDLDDMYNAISYYPHEKYNYKIQQNVGFGHLLTFNTSESLFEEQPIFFNEGNILFVFKGRIDNRIELTDRLNIVLKDNLTDGEIALKTWLEWGEKSCNKILGDWAFACFDLKKQEFFIARDHHGYTALHYYYDEKRIIFSSSIKSILNLKFIKKEINNSIIISSLAIFNSNNRLDETYYKDIYKLNPAHYIRANREKFLLQRYWYPESISVNKTKKLDDYVEEFTNIFNTAVKDRLRSYKPVCSMLSGGLDSGTVAYTGAELLKEQGKKLRTYSHVPLYEVSKNINDLRFGDEKPYIESTAKTSGNIEPIYLKSENISVLDGMLKVLEVLDSPIHAGVNAYWLIDIISSSSLDGFGTILTGEHGNATISFSGYENALSLKNLYKQLGLKTFTKRKILKPLIKNNLPKLYNFLKKEEEINLETYSYINPDLFYELREQMKKENHDEKFSLDFKSHQEFCLKILQPSFNLRCYIGGVFSDYYGIEMRDPTADKRVIEYILTIPNEMFFSEDGKNKQIIRKMMKNKLPDNVLFTNKKGLQSADIGLRAFNNKNEISSSINELYKSDFINTIIDTRKLKSDWVEHINAKSNMYNTFKLHHILRTLMVGNFILDIRRNFS